MALNQINPTQDPQQKKSPLETAATILGVVTNLSNAGVNAYKAMGTTPQDQYYQTLNEKEKLLKVK